MGRIQRAIGALAFFAVLSLPGMVFGGNTGDINQTGLENIANIVQVGDLNQAYIDQ